MNISYHLNKVDGEVDRLLAGADVVGDDVRHEGVFGRPRVGLLLQETLTEEEKKRKGE